MQKLLVGLGFVVLLRQTFSFRLCAWRCGCRGRGGGGCGCGFGDGFLSLVHSLQPFALRLQRMALTAQGLQIFGRVGSALVKWHAVIELKDARQQFSTRTASPTGGGTNLFQHRFRDASSCGFE